MILSVGSDDSDVSAPPSSVPTPAPAPGVFPPNPPPPGGPPSDGPPATPAPSAPITIQHAPNSPNTARPPCAVTYTPESRKSFADMIQLLAAAEAALAQNGIVSVKDQIHALRGIYYGTTWSLDYAGRPGSPGMKSLTRSEGFNHFTRPSVDDVKSTTPPDIQGFLCCGLFEALYNNQDWSDQTDSGRKLDFGHVLIGLDARYDAGAVTGNVTYKVYKYGINVKTVDMGGTGFEVVTWVGDLGGGAGMLAKRRGMDSSPAPDLIKNAVFSNVAPYDSDYGGYVNLEGDVAAAVVGSAGSTLGEPVFSGRLSDAMRDYLAPGSSSWNSRAATFLRMHGGAVDGSGNLTNRAALVSSLGTRIAAFSCNYVASRVNDGDITLDQGKAGAFHVVGASNEVASVFVDALVAAQAAGATVSAYTPGVTFPPPSPPASQQSCVEQIGAAGWGRWLP
jgi:hypothetical protein